MIHVRAILSLRVLAETPRRGAGNCFPADLAGEQASYPAAAVTYSRGSKALNFEYLAQTIITNPFVES